MKITLEEIRAAQARIANYVLRTPFLPFPYLEQIHGGRIWLKCENFQHMGSFKIRGATNCILNNLAQAKRKGVTTASAGNHAQGVAAICQKLGIQATIVMPTTTPPIKIEKTKVLGAQVKLAGERLDESFLFAEKLAVAQDFLFVHPFLDPHIVAGQASVALEMIDEPDFSQVEAVVIPVGGGGLIGGCAKVLKENNPKLKVYGVIAQNAPAMSHSFKAKQAVDHPLSYTLADGVAFKKVRKDMLELILKNVDDIYCIGEDAIADAISTLSERASIVSEGSGALGVGALLENKIPEKDVAVVLSGGNIDLPALAKVLYRGLVTQGRLIRLVITISDLPGGLHALTGALSKLGANILQVFHQRGTLKTGIGETRLEVELETRNQSHSDTIVEELEKQKWQVERVF